ncbi:hypothetical protein TWF281_009718 [Arthrobotrys megalospora]
MSTTAKLRDTLARAPRNSAYARHIQKCLQYVDYYGGSVPTVSKGTTERDLLEQEFEFLRDDSNESSANDTAKEIAKKYYDNLFREFALIELSRWREGQVALRWRTKQEVLQGLGQFTCASLTCPRHASAPTHEEAIDEFRLDDTRASNTKSEEGEGVELETFEMNFGYVEKGVKKNALVKVCVCQKCAGKLRRVKGERKGDDRQKRRGSRDRRDSRDRRHRRHREENEEHASRPRRRESRRRHRSRDGHKSDRRGRRDESERRHRSNHRRASRSRSPVRDPA